MNSDSFVMWLITLSVVALVGFVIAASIQDSRRWNEFAKAHECKLIGKTSSSLIPAFGTNGQTTFITVPGTETYVCNDGVTYTR